MGVDRTVYSGFTNKTAENLLLDAGAFFINFEVGQDTYESAKATKLLGATRGGGKFTAKPKIRSIEVDGVKGLAKGLQVIDEWEVGMEANILEVTPEMLSKALTSAEKDESSVVEGYEKIVAKNYIELDDYIKNVTFIGKLSKGGKPIIIQIYNALNMEGLSLQTKDKDEAVIAMKFAGTYDTGSLDTPPFAIYYPKGV